MTSGRKPWTAGELAAELAKYPPETPLRVDVANPDGHADWGHVVLGAARGQGGDVSGGEIPLTPFLVIESRPLAE